MSRGANTVRGTVAPALACHEKIAMALLRGRVIDGMSGMACALTARGDPNVPATAAHSGDSTEKGMVDATRRLWPTGPDAGPRTARLVSCPSVAPIGQP